MIRFNIDFGDGAKLWAQSISFDYEDFTSRRAEIYPLTEPKLIRIFSRNKVGHLAHCFF